MGEVYRASDPKLKRQVAIKILPESLAGNAERLSRFQREAELLASLNHPNIASLFGIEDTHAGTALIMEVVDGHDLRDRIARGPVPIAEAMPIALQLARAIGAAHERGIVHRDLKPGNIRLRSDGTIKVLDFGLAKAVAPEQIDSDATVTATRSGTIMGTPRYMSPEQARGESAHEQTDIWSFGVIVFELLTGRAVFDAPSSIETLSRVLNHEPDFNLLPPTLHPRVKLLLQRCLRKNQSQRLHHIGDAALELEEAVAAPIEESVPKSTTRWPVAVAAAAIVALSGLGGWLWTTREPVDRARVIRSDLTVPGRLSGIPIGNRRVAFSRDGQRIAIATNSSLNIRRLDEPGYVVVDGGASNPVFSPDGQMIAFFDLGSQRAGVVVVPASGGTPKLLAATADRPAGVDWREDGTLVFATAAGVFSVKDTGAELRPLAKPDAAAQQRILAWPHFLPGTNAVLLTVTTTGDAAGSRLARLDLDSLALTDVLHNASGARYLPDGRLVYASGNKLRVAQFAPQRPALTADEGVETDVEIHVAPDNGAADFALSDAGDLIYLPPSSRVELTNSMAWINRQGTHEVVDIPLKTFAYPRVSPDGNRIAFDSNNGVSRDVWVHDIRQKRTTQLTFNSTEDNQPIWSRDGTRLFFASDRSGNFDIYSIAADGATGDRLELAAPRIQFPNSALPDGAGMFVLEDYVDTGLIRFPQPQGVERILTGKPSARLAELSPDGKWLAYESTEIGPPAVFVRPYPNVNDRRHQISATGGRYPLWNPSGNGELFFVSAEGQMMAAQLAMPSLEVRKLTRLFDAGFRPPPGLTGRPFDLSPTDGRFIFSRVQGLGSAETKVALITNWGRSVRSEK